MGRALQPSLNVQHQGQLLRSLKYLILISSLIMLWTPVRHSGIARSIQKLLPNKLPPSLAGRPGNLYEVISRTPGGGVGKKVHQLRWSDKQIGDSYWLITRSKFKCEGKHGKAWGVLYWKGMSANKQPNLKFTKDLTLRQPCESKGGEDTRGIEIHME